MNAKIAVALTFVLILGNCGRKHTEQAAERGEAGNADTVAIVNIGGAAPAMFTDTASTENNGNLRPDSNYISCDSLDTRDRLVFRLIKEPVSAKVGDKLVLNVFEKEWAKDYDNPAQSAVWLNSLSHHSYLLYDSNRSGEKRIDAKCFRELFDVKPTLPPDIFGKKLLSNRFNAIAIKVAEQPNYMLYAVLTEPSFKLECDNCEYDYLAGVQSLISVSGGKIISSLIVEYGIGNGLGFAAQHFFYDYENKRIHIKQFYNDESGGWFDGYQIYQITQRGEFIRYYKQDGRFESDNERGFVKNQTREGKWVDMFNGYYIESEYKNGLPAGEWRYHRIVMVNEYSKEGAEISSSRQKGDLHYTETYEGGKLVKREFV